MCIARAAFVIAILLVPASQAQAEVKKFAIICGGQICPSYEIALNPPDGWAEDKAASKENKMQLIFPRGKNFGNADALIYVKVSLKNKEQPLSDFIRVSQERWRKAVPDTKITKLSAVARANGKPAFETYRYENPSRPQQALELTAFGVDSDKDGNDFVIQVVMTGRAKTAIEQAGQTFLRGH